MPLRNTILRHALVSAVFVMLYLLLNRPEIVFFSRVGFVAWYPAIGLVMALMVGLTPRYAILVWLAAAFAGRVTYGQPIMSYSNTVDAVGIAICYGTAAYVLRGAVQIDLGLRRRQDVGNGFAGARSERLSGCRRLRRPVHRQHDGDGF